MELKTLLVWHPQTDLPEDVTVALIAVDNGTQLDLYQSSDRIDLKDGVWVFDPDSRTFKSINGCAWVSDERFFWASVIDLQDQLKEGIEHEELEQ